ncbi:hypothetical protein J4447_01605 [Candidatus Pacearchaeota archaeon]|nr:hypothetical protein [Candidatus Pacearchaeota archaeon]
MVTGRGRESEGESREYLETHTVPLEGCWYNVEERTLMMEGMMNERGVESHKVIFYGAEPRADGTWNVDGCEMYTHPTPREVLEKILRENKQGLKLYLSSCINEIRAGNRLREAVFGVSFSLILSGAIYGILELINK